MKLEVFCGRRSKNMDRVMTTDSVTYATNGHVIVWIDQPDVSLPRSAVAREKSITELLSAFPDEFVMPVRVDDMNIPEPRMKTCPECKGTGREPKSCMDCEGDGEVSFRSYSGISYSFDCALCDGSGYSSIDFTDEKCDFCGGSGKDTILDTVDFEWFALNADYLRKFRDHFEHAVIDIGVEPLGPKPVRFDGGRGFIMPRSKL